MQRESSMGPISGLAFVAVFLMLLASFGHLATLTRGPLEAREQFAQPSVENVVVPAHVRVQRRRAAAAEMCRAALASPEQINSQLARSEHNDGEGCRAQIKVGAWPSGVCSATMLLVGAHRGGRARYVQTAWHGR